MKERQERDRVINFGVKGSQDEKMGIGIDFGTVNLLVYIQGHGIIFDEPSVLAYDKVSGDVIAIGKDADSMTGKTHDKIRIVRPLRDGVISDLRAARDLLSHVFDRVKLHGDLKETKVVICCPSEVTQIEREALKKLASDIGSDEVFIEEEIKSGVVGSNVDIYSSKGAMIVDIGGGTTDVGILALGDVVVSKSIRTAGNFIDHEIIKYLRQVPKIDVGQKMAEKVKIEMATLNPAAEDKLVKVAGRDLMTGIPKYAEINTSEVREVLLPIFEGIYKLIVETFKVTPPELCSDIYYDGVILSGGGSQVDFLDKFLSDRLGVPVHRSQNPMTAVVLGTKILINAHGLRVNYDEYALMSQ